jgi:flagellin-like hook-associated protein FlgL
MLRIGPHNAGSESLRALGPNAWWNEMSLTSINTGAGPERALHVGSGALVDADQARESANLRSLKLRQQVSAQALSLANQAPQTLLSLFK